MKKHMEERPSTRTPATAIGAQCDPIKAINLECGLGGYCNRTTSLCEVARTGGAACTEDLQCMAGKCEGGQPAAKTCKAEETIPKLEECKGP